MSNDIAVRFEGLREELEALRSMVKDRLVEYFSDMPTAEVIGIMADWLPLDELLELNSRVELARKILYGEEA